MLRRDQRRSEWRASHCKLDLESLPSTLNVGGERLVLVDHLSSSEADGPVDPSALQNAELVIRHTVIVQDYILKQLTGMYGPSCGDDASKQQ